MKNLLQKNKIPLLSTGETNFVEIEANRLPDFFFRVKGLKMVQTCDCPGKMDSNDHLRKWNGRGIVLKLIWGKNDLSGTAIFDMLKALLEVIRNRSDTRQLLEKNLECQVHEPGQLRKVYFHNCILNHPL